MQECPETPELRTAVVSVNFKLRQAKSSEERWQKLAYTLNESPISTSLAATPLQPHSFSPIVFPPYRVKKKNTSNRGDDKTAAEKDSV